MNMSFRKKWAQATQRKSTLLCVGLDPTEFGQRENQTIPENFNKLEWCLNIVDQVFHYAAAIKINRNFIRDLSRAETKQLVDKIHNYGMVAIDDAKLSDLGSSNHAGLYQAKMEGFDAVTFSPFPGNTKEVASQAEKLGIGVIALVLMSNPEYEKIKTATIDGLPFYEFIAREVEVNNIDGVVIGAISQSNHLRPEEINKVCNILKDQVVLVPGVGQQEGSADLHIELFGNRTIVNVGRSIVYTTSPNQSAKQYNATLRAA